MAPSRRTLQTTLAASRREGRALAEGHPAGARSRTLLVGREECSRKGTGARQRGWSRSTLDANCQCPEDADPHPSRPTPVKTVRCGCTNANRHPPFFPYRSRAHCCLDSLAPSLSRTVPLHLLYKPSLARPLSDSSYLPCWEGQAHVSASSTLISCIAQRGLVGVRLSFGDAAGAIFAGLHSRECFFIDCSAWCIALRKKFFC